MDILKKLNLNKSPKALKSGSLVCAKNMMVDETAAYLTNEYGFDVEFECPNQGEFIVGCIPCNTEICIFTYNYLTAESNIYRLAENGNYSVIKSNWSYSGGKICGSYTYNYKGELILAVGEYDAYYNNGEAINVPLKSWNVDNMTNKSLSYNVEEDIPKFDVEYNVSTNGSLISGVYTFFIRFKVDEASYTKWFQITDDIVIYNLIQKEAPRHSYILDDVKTDANTDEFPVFELNDNALSNKSVIIDINFGDNVNYNEYQIGYIIKRNTEILGRIENTYNIGTPLVNIINNKFNAEISVDSFLENPHQYYNVKNVINYNNRLYIANYSEYKNENLQNYADSVLAKIHLESAGSISKTETKKYYKARVSFQNPQIDDVTWRSIDGISTYVGQDNKIYINNPIQFVRDNIAPTITLVNNNGDRDKITEKNYKNVVIEGKNYRMEYDYTLVLFDDRRGEVTYEQLNIFSTLDNAVTSNSFDIRIDEGILIFVDHTHNDNLLKLKEGDHCFYNIRYRQQVYDSFGTKVMDDSFWVWSDYFANGQPNQNLKRGYKALSDASEETISYVVNSDLPCNNNRTLIPGQVYSFYIHYIRKDFSATDGFRITNTNGTAAIKNCTEGGAFALVTSTDNVKLFLCPGITTPTDDKYLIHPIFSNIEIPDGYIGFFISYEDIETTSIPVVCLRGGEFGTNVSNTAFQYDEEPVFGDSKTPIIGAEYNPVSTTVKEKNTSKYREPNIRIMPRLNDTLTTSPIGSAYRNAIVVTEKTLYNKTTKTLYRLTPNIYTAIDDEHTADTDKAFMFAPGFYNAEKVVAFDKDIIANPTASNVLDPKGNPVTYTIVLHNYNNYSQQPLNAYSLKQDYNYGAVSLIHNDGKVIGVFYNSVLSPDRLPNFLEIKAAYKAKPSKSYTNYSKDHLDRFDKTIYRSDVVSDESLVNGFRHFDINNYRNILENKGKITNLIGIGLYLIIHTEYSLFVFDRSPKLSSKAQLDIPDVFDIDYQELLPANEGFGGLYDKEESIISKHGYIWFDRVNKVIFRYENGKIDIISSDINTFLKRLNIHTVRFAEDVISQRLIICIYLVEQYDNGEHLSLTLSYNFITNTFISLHDYTFTHNYRTYNKSYIFDENKDRRRLYSYNTTSVNLHNLKNNNAAFYPKYELNDI